MRSTSIQKTLALCGLILFPLSIVAVGPKSALARNEAQAAAGSLDPSFGNGGIATTEFSGADEGDALIIQPDGKIIVAGGAGINFGLARYNPDGTPDSGFGAGGKVLTLSSLQGGPHCSVALQSDGKILFAGAESSPTPGSPAVVIRYNSDGSLDSGFGVGGKVILNVGGSAIDGLVALGADGKIIIATNNTTPTSSQIVLARLSSGGALDASFGKAGIVAVPSVNPVDVARALATQPDGKILISGYTQPSRDRFLLVRLNPDGSPDAGFGTGGFVTTDFAESAFSLGVLRLPDGKLVAVGETVSQNNSVTSFAVARYSADGSLDASFGSGGKVITDFPGGLASAFQAAPQPGARLVVAGQAQSNSGANCAIALARYNFDGSLDTNFGTGGKTITSVFGYYDQALAVSAQPDNNLVVAGASNKMASGPRDFSVLRYIGGPPASFSLGLGETTVNADQGTKIKIGMSINRLAGFTGNVTIAPPDSAQGVRFKPPDPISTTDPSISLKLKIAATAPTGPQQLTFTGKSDDGQVSTATLTLNIQ